MPPVKDGYDSDDEDDHEAFLNKNDPLFPAKNWRPDKAVREGGDCCLRTRNLESFRHKYNRHYVKTGSLELPSGGCPGTAICALKGKYSRAMTYDHETFVDTYVVMDCVLTTKTSFRGK